MNLKLRRYREEMGLTQRQFSKEIGKSVGTIQAWEGGFSYPNAETIWDMCVLFDTDPSELLGWWDEHPRPAAPSSDLTEDEGRLLRNYRAALPSDRPTIDRTAQLSAQAAGEVEEAAPRPGRGDPNWGVTEAKGA